MPVFTKPAGEQAFAAGKVGLEFQTTGALRSTRSTMSATSSSCAPAKIPLIDPENGHLPTGGNAVVILTNDTAKQDAVWKFAKFAAGPYGASVVVPGTGYVPNNELAAKRSLSRRFLQEEPAVPGRAQPDAADGSVVCLPGHQWREGDADDRRQSVALVDQKATPEETLKSMSSEVARLLPR